MRIGAGTANTGAFMSWGTAATTERALGMVSSGTLAAVSAESYYGARITNNTGGTLVSFTLSYTGEQWRDGGGTGVASIAQSITFDYSLNAATIQDGAATFTDVAALNFVGPNFGATTADTTSNIVTNQNDRDGNSAGSRTVIGPVTVSGLNWLNGTDLWIRWVDINDASNDHGLGIDDLSFRAIAPEPGSALVWGCIALIGVAVLRRLS
jgi:hypothetical protein